MNTSNKDKDKDKQPQPILNNVKQRLLMLSPTVSQGLERECNKDDFEALDDKALGKGGFGHVWKVRHKVTQKIYAIKVINKDYIRKEKMVAQINREIDIMYRTNHPHIIKLYNHYEDDDNFYLVMQCAMKGQLYSQLKRLKRLDERTTAQYMRELISAVQYLHSLDPPIIHRDIKPENILLDKDLRAKLADFGWSNFSESNKERDTYCGTPEYLAPEMVTKSGHNESIDIWSIGVLMFELLAGRPPFIYKNDIGALYSDIKNLKIVWTDDFPTLAKNLVAKILKIKPSERLSLAEILDHPWFKEVEPIRPVLPYEEYDPETKLRSHLINYVPEESESSSDSSESMPTDSNKKPNKNEIKLPNDTQINNGGEYKQILNGNNFVDNSVLLKLRQENNNLKEELNTKEKIIGNLKKKLDSFNNNEKTITMKDQERTSILNELEHKGKKLLECEMNLKLLKSEKEHFEKEKEQLRIQNDELFSKIEYFEKSNRELTLKISQIEQERQQETLNYEKKLRIAELTYLERKNDQVDESDKITVMINENLKELNELIKIKFERLDDRIIMNERELADEKSKNEENLERKCLEMTKVFKETYERVLNEERNLHKKQIEELGDKNINYSKNLDWYKNQINELYPYKQKVNQDSYLISKLTSQKETLSQTNSVLEEKLNYLENFTKMLNESLQKTKSIKESYKNAFLEAEKLFQKYVKNKNLRDLINFKEFMD